MKPPMQFFALAAAVAACSAEPVELPGAKGELVEMALTSSAFENGKNLPRRFSCDGDGVSPPLAWSPIPEGTRSFALVLDDPDAPGKVFQHWVAWNIPADWTSLPEDVKPEDEPPTQGKNDQGKIGYGPPCPPKTHGAHHYEFHLFAADIEPALADDAMREQLYSALDGHVLGLGELTALYDR